MERKFTCPGCGKEFEGKQSPCPYCGATIKYTSDLNNEDGSKNPLEKKKKSPIEERLPKSLVRNYNLLGLLSLVVLLVFQLVFFFAPVFVIRPLGTRIEQNYTLFEGFNFFFEGLRNQNTLYSVSSFQYSLLFFFAIFSLALMLFAFIGIIVRTVNFFTGKVPAHLYKRGFSSQRGQDPWGCSSASIFCILLCLVGYFIGRQDLKKSSVRDYIYLNPIVNFTYVFYLFAGIAVIMFAMWFYKYKIKMQLKKIIIEENLGI